MYPPLPQFLNAKKGEQVVVDWKSVPGLRKCPASLSFISLITYVGVGCVAESGWTPAMIET